MHKRCAWVDLNSPLYVDYHDTVWGVAVHNDRTHFEFITLEGAQAGLSWITILKKREQYQLAFDDFDFEKIARYDDAKIESLMQNSGLVRNRRKIESTIGNARVFIKIIESHGSFDSWVWRFVNNAPIINDWKALDEVPITTAIAQDLSKSLKAHGFKFVGPTIVYSYMQATGMICDHETQCFCHPNNCR